ncbi:Uncharacterised protein [uncultured archaeon]|nr:Uncharacterised protein [uncultured archaeon]
MRVLDRKYNTGWTPKVGDWGMHNYKLVQVKRVEDGHVHEVSDGSFCTSSNDLTVWSLRLDIVSWARSIAWYMDKFHGMGVDLNMPDISGHCDNLFDNGAQALLDEDKEAFVKVAEQAQKFYREVEDLSLNAKITKVQSISIFRK